METVALVDGIERVVGGRAVGDLFGEVPIALGTTFPFGFRAAEPSRVMRVEAQDYHAIAASAPEVGVKLGDAGAGADRRAAGHHGRPASAARDRGRASLGRVVRAAARASSTATRSRSGGSPRIRRMRPSSGAAPLPAGRGLPRDPRRRREDRGAAAAEPGGRAAGPRPPKRPPREYDTVIVGAGPAGLAAAVYGASEGLRTIVVEREAPGGQAGTSSRIENYLGFPSGVSGDELASRALQQARRLGAEILVTRSITRIDVATRQVHLDGGDVLQRPDDHPRLRVSRGGTCRSRDSTGWSARASPTAPRAARRRPRTGSTSTSSVRATRPGRRRCSSPPTRAA